VPYKNTAYTFTYYAWDVINGVPKTGDSGNHVARGIGDGTEFTPASPALTEVDSTNCPGLYKATFSASENNYFGNTCYVKSSTTGIYIHPVQWQNQTFAVTLTEGYAADGAAPTLEQLLFMTYSLLATFSFSGVTQTVKKIDKSTTAMTFTLDSATVPTSHTRAT